MRSIERAKGAFRSACVMAAMAMAIALASCTVAPDEPTISNPFDPSAPVPGSGYELQATVAGDSVTLSWPDRDVVSWIVRHSATTDVFAQMDDISVTNLVTRAGGRASLVHKGMVREAVNYYAVRGQGMVPGVPVALDVPALFQPAGGRRNVAARAVQVQVRTGVADRVELSADAGFTDPVGFDVLPGQLTNLPWTLPTAAAAGDTLRVYGRVRTASTVGPTRQVRFVATFNPTVTPLAGQRLSGTNLVVVDTLVVLQPTGDGIVDLILRRTVGEQEEVIEPEDPNAPFTLSVPVGTVDPVRWVVDFGSDFGYRVSRNINLTPALEITGAALSVVGGAQTTTEREIRLLVTANGAGQMIVSEDPGFADTTWTAMADTLDFVLSEGLGTKTVYAAFRNPFTSDRPTASVGITYLVPPARAQGAGAADGATTPTGRPR